MTVEPMAFTVVEYAAMCPSRYRQGRDQGQSGGGANKKIRDQPHALEPTLSKEMELGPEAVGRPSICENHSGNTASLWNGLDFYHVRLKRVPPNSEWYS